MRIKSRIKNLKEHHKKLFVAIVILLFLFIVFFGARFYLLFNFLVGNDMIVKLTASDQEISLSNSESKEIKFESYISTNYFCRADCQYVLTDLGNLKELDRGEFTTTISNPKINSYEITAPKTGKGQKLYHFQVECSSKKTQLCKTQEKPKKVTYLVAMNYNESEAQLDLRNQAKIKLDTTERFYENLKKISNKNQKERENISKIILIKTSQKENLEKQELEIKKLIENWNSYEYEEIIDSKTKEELNERLVIQEKEQKEITEIYTKYNRFVNNLSKNYEELVNLTKVQNLSLKDTLLIEELISDYTNLEQKTSSIFNLTELIKIENNLSKKIKETQSNLATNSINNHIFTSFTTSNLDQINQISDIINGSKINLDPQKEICCYFNECRQCCKDNCSSNKELYPIILLHGHSFNEKISAEDRLSDFNDIKDALFKDQVIDGGYIIVDNFENPMIFSKTNNQMVFSASYFFDIYQEDSETLKLQSKDTSLDTYALRLNDIIENVKVMTNRDKVYIVAHSMGGLVTRKYLKTFGEEDVKKLIMLGTPNKGIDGYIRRACPVFGANIHCEMMDEESLFIKKLNNPPYPEINVAMISGYGCITEGEVSDGIVKNSSAYLSWAKMHYIKGNCSSTQFFHTEMRDVNQYPEVYEIIKEELGIK